MTDPLIDTLPLAQRLALSYAPANMREDILTLLLLDNRLAGILRNRSEAIIAQMKLAWWRDRLGDDPSAWPAGEPLLERLREWRAPPSQLLPLINGWEALLADDLTVAGLEEFARGRAGAWQAITKPEDAKIAVGQAARHWALADIALNLDNDGEAAAAKEFAMAVTSPKSGIPRAMRPLAVLRGLTQRALQNGNREVLDGPRAAFVALRIGLTGR